MALHEVQLKGYSVRPGNLSLGTYDSYGIEQLHVTLDDTWSRLAIDATFHNTPNDKGVTMLVDADGLVTVPPEACKQPSKYATITFRGVQDGVQRISCNLPYVVLDHAQVPGANSTATPSENAQALAQMQALRDGAVDAKNQAEAARDDAAKSAVAAKESETNAGQSATAAKTAQSAAETAKAGAETAQKAAASSASSASTSASTATTQAAAAKSSATTAKASEAAAGKSAKEAAASAANLDSAVNTATQKAAAASASAEAAKASESAAASSEAAARKYANSAELAAKTAGEAAAEKLQQMQVIQDDVTAKQAQTATDATAAEKAKVAAEAAQKGAAASETASADSAAAAKASEDAAAKSAADADSTANSINNSMMQIAANKEAVSQLKEDTAALQKRQNVLVGSETGNLVSCDDAFAAPLCGLTVYGRSTQDGTPTPDAPVPIVSAGDGGSVTVKATGKNLLNIPDESGTARGVTVTAKDGLISISGTATSSGYAKLDIPPFIASGVVILSSSITSPKVKLVSETWSVILSLGAADKMSDMATRIVFIVTQGQTYNLTGVKVQLELGTTATAYSPYREQLLTLPTPTGLPGIPVTSGGNYTDENGQQWICDEVDLEKGVKVQRVNAVDLSTCTITGTTNLAATKRLAIRLPLKGKDYTAKALCNRLPYLVSFTSDTIHFYVDVNNAQVFIPIGAKNPEEGEYILFYILDAPIETPLTPAEIAAYKALISYAPDTVVQASDGAGVKLDYQRDVNLVVKNLEDAIASMTTT
jgi:hypothetical protein